MIRKGTMADMPAVLEMCKALHAESPRYRDRSFDEQKIMAGSRRMLEGTLTTEALGGAFIAEKNGEIIGMLGAFITETPFGHDRIATDYTLYVKPQHRGGMAAVRLIKAFEQWAIENGASDIIPGTSTMLNAERTRDLYLALGYEMYGYSMIKRIR